AIRMRDAQQQDRDNEQRHGRADGDRRLQHALLVVKEQQQGASHQRQHDRQDDEVFGCRDHLSGSLPSTWSVPVKPRAARSTTRNRAVVAKPITIAVSTSAWGIGSANVEGSTSAPGTT